MIKTIISDLGAVVVFFDNQIFLRKLENYSDLSCEEMMSVIGKNMDLLRLFDTGTVSPEGFYREACRILKCDIEFETFFRIYSDIFSLNPPVLKTLKEAKQKHRLVLLSNTDVMRFDFVKKAFPELLIFDDYILSYKVGYMKPDPRIYEAALLKAYAKPEECVFIDDRDENIQAALEAGIKGILFGPETDLKAELIENGLTF